MFWTLSPQIRKWANEWQPESRDSNNTGCWIFLSCVVPQLSLPRYQSASHTVSQWHVNQCWVCQLSWNSNNPKSLCVPFKMSLTHQIRNSHTICHPNLENQEPSISYWWLERPQQDPRWERLETTVENSWLSVVMTVTQESQTLTRPTALMGTSRDRSPGSV